jgi:hypothetical protein
MEAFKISLVLKTITMCSRSNYQKYIDSLSKNSDTDGLGEDLILCLK